MASNILNRYENMLFPPYKYRPYPKHITLQDGSGVIVSDAHTERSLIGMQPDAARVAAAALTEDRRQKDLESALGDDKDALLVKAGDLGIVMHRNCSIQTIKDAITQAEAALSA